MTLEERVGPQVTDSPGAAVGSRAASQKVEFTLGRDNPKFRDVEMKSVAEPTQVSVASKDRGCWCIFPNWERGPKNHKGVLTCSAKVVA